jgi:hypothetical protein
MPFKWQQKPDLKWAPRGVVTGEEGRNVQIATRHFQDQSKLGIQDFVLINLIDKKGNQKLLGENFQKVIASLKNDRIRYVWFDFHHECRKMQYGNLGKLIENIKLQLNSFQQFAFTSSKLNVI